MAANFGNRQGIYYVGWNGIHAKLMLNFTDFQLQEKGVKFELICASVRSSGVLSMYAYSDISSQRNTSRARAPWRGGGLAWNAEK